MIHHLNALTLTEKLRESLQDSGDGFPFAAVEANLAEYANNCASWHWHEFVELAYVAEGALECATPGGTFTLSAGQGYFINPNILHLHRMRGSAATLRVIEFMPSLLAGSGGLYARYVAPVERCRGIEALMLSREKPLEGEILDKLKELFDLAQREPKGFELTIMEGLFHIWRAMVEITAPMLRRPGGDRDASEDRIKSMLTFIHTHYDEPLGVAAIAASANISEREAYRCFRQVLGTTPTLYLLHHRIDRAARMLVETRMTVTQISLACGFSSPSYLCKVFHDLNGASPRAFRIAQGR